MSIYCDLLINLKCDLTLQELGNDTFEDGSVCFDDSFDGKKWDTCRKLVCGQFLAVIAKALHCQFCQEQTGVIRDDN